MTFEDEMNVLESIEFDNSFVIKKGSVPILFSAPHTMEQINNEGVLKYREYYTKAISLFLNKNYNTYSIVKLKDTGIDSNKDNYDQYNIELKRLIKEENIKLVIDLHGASKERKFDVEFGTLNNLTADFSTIKELEESFIENGVKNIKHNDPFKGGAITQGLYKIKEIDVIQIEINGTFRDFQNINNLEKIVKSFAQFIEQYKKYYTK